MFCCLTSCLQVMGEEILEYERKTERPDVPLILWPHAIGGGPTFVQYILDRERDVSPVKHFKTNNMEFDECTDTNLLHHDAF